MRFSLDRFRGFLETLSPGVRGKGAAATSFDSGFGGFSNPAKMPGLSWSISATLCKVGSALRRMAKEKGIPTPCGFCYARKGNYARPNVKAALQRRIEAYESDPSRWAAAIVLGIREIQSSRSAAKRALADFFRFFDSGDLQSTDMLRAIIAIANELPEVSFWLPTQERGIVAAVLRDTACPLNLVIRVSDPRIGQAPPSGPGAGLRSRVRIPGSPVERNDYACPAYKQGGECRDCRACWDARIPLVSYPRH